MKNILEKIKGIPASVKKNPKKFLIIGVIVVAVLFFVNGFKQFRAQEAQDSETDTVDWSSDGTDDSYIYHDPGSDEYTELYDQEVIDRQPDLIQRFGKLPEGYLWDLDGNLISVGDKSMTAEEVVYAYLNGVRTLDFSSAQRFSRNSMVVARYENFFNAQDARESDYSDSFYRNMYREALSSIQIKGISNTAVFAENKQVFTVEIEMIDLSSKDFWEKDKEEIYNTLYVYSSDEDDAVKSEQYVYDYALDYYKNGDPVTRNVTINLTVEKYAKLDTGWLVTIDKDVDDYCYYTDGNVIVRYILNAFRDEGREYVKELRDIESDQADEDPDVDVSPESTFESIETQEGGAEGSVEGTSNDSGDEDPGV